MDKIIKLTFYLVSKILHMRVHLVTYSVPQSYRKKVSIFTHTHTHARTHARTHAHTHTHAVMQGCLYSGGTTAGLKKKHSLFPNSPKAWKAVGTMKQIVASRPGA